MSGRCAEGAPSSRRSLLACFEESSESLTHTVAVAGHVGDDAAMDASKPGRGEYGREAARDEHPTRPADALREAQIRRNRMRTPEQVAQALVDACNARDMDGILKAYATDSFAYGLPGGEVILKGHDEIRRKFASVLGPNVKLRVEVKVSGTVAFSRLSTDLSRAAGETRRLLPCRRHVLRYGRTGRNLRRCFIGRMLILAAHPMMSERVPVLIAHQANHPVAFGGKQRDRSRRGGQHHAGQTLGFT